MSFTEDELQAFNTILERRLSAHRQEMERALDQRIQALRRELDQRLATTQQETLRALARQLISLQNTFNAMLNQKFDEQQKCTAQIVSSQAERSQQQSEALLDRGLAAQLLEIEQLLGQRLQELKKPVELTGADQYVTPQIEAIEVQTDLPWEDLEAVFGKVLDTRLAELNESIQAALKDWEQHVSGHLNNSHEQVQPYNGDIVSATNTQEMLRGIEHLERIIESMQVVMTTNHALLSNRLYHHQQLPLERAHPTGRMSTTPPNGATDPLSLPGEHGDAEMA